MCASRIATPAKSFADDAEPASVDLPPRAPATEIAKPALGRGGQVGLLVLNAMPLLHALTVLALLFFPSWEWPVRGSAAAIVLWLAPPLACRALFAWSPLSDGAHALGSRAFWVWWTSLKLQTLYLRLPFLEEVLRLVPGLYSAWMRLWGARVGRLTYWAPGLEITDRPLLDVGNNVVFGGKARLGAHVLRRSADGQLELLVGRIRLGDRCMIGAQSALGPGVRFADDEFTRAFFLAPPFSHWRGGQRIRDQDPSSPPPTST